MPRAQNLLTHRGLPAMFMGNLIESGRGTGPMKPRQPPRPAKRRTGDQVPNPASTRRRRGQMRC